MLLHLLPVILALTTKPLFCEAVVDKSATPSVLGTFNASFIIGEVPAELAYSLLPAKYRDSKAILPPDSAKFPGIKDGMLPILLELGRETNSGPPGLQIENFQEAKIRVPNVKLDSSSPFIYSRLIATDVDLIAQGSKYQFGLNASVETFVPANSNEAQDYNYIVKNVVEVRLSEVAESSLRYPVSTYEFLRTLPWFGDKEGDCAQHFYDASSALVKRLSGQATLYPPLAGKSDSPVSFAIEAIHGVYNYIIVGPQACKNFI
ncbi:hypothetical protein Moror_2498 [Moniliophthora roreri MCA 2997]|uniref:Uncharacterized protein n=1 Tax=Moniliophthora roreri (strain MCA 2997) TaxID=1381753 RepID=V2XGE6_MONRO|nr:hypothetical protein Moror_2498 [Moniliophthora roreri MCA 2997]